MIALLWLAAFTASAADIKALMADDPRAGFISAGLLLGSYFANPGPVLGLMILYGSSLFVVRSVSMAVASLRALGHTAPQKALPPSEDDLDRELARLDRRIERLDRS